MNIQKLMLALLSFGTMGISKPIDSTTRCYISSLLLGCLHGFTNQRILAKKGQRPNHFFAKRSLTEFAPELATGLVYIGFNEFALSQTSGFAQPGVRRQCLVFHGLGQMLGEMSTLNDDPKLNFALMWGSLGCAWDFITQR